MDEPRYAARRGRVTGSMLGTYLGFSEPDAAKYLGLPGYITGHDKSVSAHQGLQYTVEETIVRVIDYDKEWLALAVGAKVPDAAAKEATVGTGGVAGSLWRRYTQKGALPPENFGAEESMYNRLLELTKSGCEKAIVAAKIESVKGRDTRRFI